MKILRLNLKAHWYNLIEQGVKTEEYRELKEYWIKRLYVGGIDSKPKHYDAIEFVYGYTKRTMIYEYKGLNISKGRKEWGASEKPLFVLKLGNKIT